MPRPERKVMDQEKEKLKIDIKNLLSEIILKAEHEDQLHKISSIKAGKGSQAVGESWMLFHLKVLEKHLNDVL